MEHFEATWSTNILFITQKPCFFCLPCKIALWFPCTETGQHTPYYFTPSFKSLYLFLVICFIFKLLYSYPSLLKFFPDHLPEKTTNQFIYYFIYSLINYFCCSADLLWLSHNKLKIYFQAPLQRDFQLFSPLVTKACCFGASSMVWLMVMVKNHNMDTELNDEHVGSQFRLLFQQPTLLRASH